MPATSQFKSKSIHRCLDFLALPLEGSLQLNAKYNTAENKSFSVSVTIYIHHQGCHYGFRAPWTSLTLKYTKSAYLIIKHTSFQQKLYCLKYKDSMQASLVFFSPFHPVYPWPSGGEIKHEIRSVDQKDSRESGLFTAPLSLQVAYFSF